MVAKNGIRIENIYYMLAYAFEVLHGGAYASIRGEDFDEAEDLFGQILAIGMSGLVKRGIHRDYISHRDDLCGLRGRIDIGGSLNHLANGRQLLSCVFDDFTADNVFNRILKTTALKLLRTRKLVKSGCALKRALVFFGDIDEIRDVRTIRWGELRYQRNNMHYLFLLNICRLVIDGLLMDDAQNRGDRKIRHAKFDELVLHSLYEAFLLGYFRRHYDLNVAAPKIAWDMDECALQYNADQLPEMRSDVVMSDGQSKLIIDAKFYKETAQEFHGSFSVKSANIYQIFSYVVNERAHADGHEVSGMLLYARTDEVVQPDMDVEISGSRISARTLDLNRPFADIQNQLDGIAKEYFGDVHKKC